MSFRRSASRSCSTTSASVSDGVLAKSHEQARRPVVAAAADDHDARAHVLAAYARSARQIDAARPRPRSRPRRRAAARRRRSRNGCGGRRRRTRRRAAGSRRRPPRAAATKPGADATKPSTVSTRSMRSSSPSSACSTDSAFNAHQRAASAPSSTERSSPSTPGCTSTPSWSRGSWPDVRARPPCTTTASSGSWGGNGPGKRQPELARAGLRSAHSHLSRKADVSVPCHMWPPSNTSCTSASSGAPSCA